MLTPYYTFLITKNYTKLYIPWKSKIHFSWAWPEPAILPSTRIDEERAGLHFHRGDTLQIIPEVTVEATP